MKKLIALALIALLSISPVFGQVTIGGAAGPAVGRIDATTGTLSGIGGDTMTGDTAARSNVIRGSNAYPQAATNTSGGAQCVAGGIGRRLFTVVTYGSLSGKTATVNVTDATGTITATVKTEGVNWTGATSNAVTATSLASALNSITGISATASGAVVYITPASTTCALTISTNAGAPMTATSGTDGTLTVAAPSLTGASLASPTITGHATIEGQTLTGVTGTGKLVLDTSPSINGAPVARTGPTFLIYRGSSATFTNNSVVIRALDTAGIDTASICDVVTNYRCTPNVAGYYLVTATCNVTTDGIGATRYDCYIYKNGSSVAQVTNFNGLATAHGHSVSSIAYFNGSTDYVDSRLYVNSTGTDTQTGGVGVNFLAGHYIGP